MRHAGGSSDYGCGHTWQVGVQPVIEHVFGDDDRGPVMDVTQRVLCGGGQDHAGSSHRVRPERIWSGETQQRLLSEKWNSGSSSRPQFSATRNILRRVIR